MDSWQSRLQERRAQFLIRTKARLVTIDELLIGLKQTPSDAESLKNLNRLYHQMAGAGGIYEMTEFCELTIAAEEICTRLMREKAFMNDIDHEKLVMLTAGLAAVVAAGGKAKESPIEDPVKAAVCTPRFDVLIAHHNAETQIALHNAFEKEKFRVRTVKSSSGARGACITRLPDAIIVSIPLPDSTGYDVVEQLRSMPEGHRPVVCLVGEYAAFKYKVDGIRAGADVFLEEPFDASDVVAKVKTLIRRDKTENYKILSVEDDLDQAIFITSTLESVGYSVRHIADPSLFEETLLSFAPDLVLLDIMLGDMTGHELAQFVRQHEVFATIPIIFLTTENQLNAHIESARVGGDDHLIKPIPPQLLVAAIAGRLDRYSRK